MKVILDWKKLKERLLALGKMTNWKHFLVIVGICFFGGITLWKLHDCKFITFNNEIALMDLLTFVLTSFIAVSIPLLFKKVIEDNRSVKQEMVNEVKAILELSANIYRVISEKFTTKEKIEGTDKDSILEDIHLIGIKIDSLKEQMLISFPNEKSIPQKIKDSFFEFDDKVTGGDLMRSDFNEVTHNYKKEALVAYEKHRKEIVICIHNIYKL